MGNGSWDFQLKKQKNNTYNEKSLEDTSEMFCGSNIHSYIHCFWVVTKYMDLMGSIPSSVTYFRLNIAQLLISLNLHLVYEMGDNIGAYLLVLLGGFNAMYIKGLSYIKH